MCARACVGSPPGQPCSLFVYPAPTVCPTKLKLCLRFRRRRDARPATCAAAFRAPNALGPTHQMRLAQPRPAHLPLLNARASCLFRLPLSLCVFAVCQEVEGSRPSLQQPGADRATSTIHQPASRFSARASSSFDAGPCSRCALKVNARRDAVRHAAHLKARLAGSPLASRCLEAHFRSRCASAAGPLSRPPWFLAWFLTISFECSFPTESVRHSD